jgi:hypothetical protein
MSQATVWEPFAYEIWRAGAMLSGCG